MIHDDTQQSNNNNSKTTSGRRDFIKMSTAAVVTGAMTVPKVHAAGNETIRVGLVGCGGRGSGAAIQALSADKSAKLVAVADAFRNVAEKKVEAFKQHETIGKNVLVSKDDIFDGLDGYKTVIEASDLVLLATPPGFRPLHFKAAIDAGKHVFTEKPMATDAPGARMVMESVKKSKEQNLAVLAGFCWRYSYPKRALFDRIHEGKIGDVRSIHGTYLTGPVKPMPPAKSRPEGMSDLEWQVRNWYNFAWLSGDGLVEQACHTVDWLAWAMGDKPPVSCTAVGGRQNPQDGGDIYDHVEINYEWENGARGYLAQRQIPGCFNENSLYVHGTKGDATLTRGSRMTDLASGEKWRYDGDDPNMYQVEHNEFFESIRKGEYINDGDRMIQSTLMAIMGRMAGYSGQKITWDKALASKENLTPDMSKGWDSPVEFRKVPIPGSFEQL